MLTTLTALRAALQHAQLPLEVPGVEESRAMRAEMIDQLEDYVLPRLVQIDAPLLTVVGGSTGAGKSTLVNSLVGQRVSEPGVLRPTTRSPVLVHHPDDVAWFEQQRILPELERTTRATADPDALQLVASTAIPQGLALLDAPDIDSVEERNRSLAAQLLAAADLWLFVTSAARYADQVPWGFLKQAAERSAAVAIVLDRTAAEAIPEVSSHLARMLTARGLKDSPLFTVAETPLDDNGLLPGTSVSDIRGWLTELGADVDARNAVVRQTLEGAVRTIAGRTHELADACQAQFDMQGRLKRDVDTSYDQALASIDEGSADGTLLRGEVLARWQEFVGTGELLRNLESKVSWLRDRVTNAVKGKPQQAERVTVAVESGLQTLILEHAEAAAERTDASWRSVAAGSRVLESGGVDLSRASRDFRERAERMVRDWQNGVLELVRTEGGDKRTTARFLAYGFNGLSVALMVVVFASTGGVTGAEVGIAGGSAVIGQKLLEAVFGDQAVRRLALNARRDLRVRVTALLDQERQRFIDRLDTLELPSDSSEQLRVLAGECRACGLCAQRKQAVFGVGAETAPWLFVGEGPGADEDEQGDPFVGQAGKLLDGMLAAIGCRRGRTLFRLAADVDRRGVPGALVDCGVWNGGSTALLAAAAPHRDAWAFDSFEGLPAPGAEDGDDAASWTASCVGREENVVEAFRRFARPEQLHIVKGWFDESLPRHAGSVGPIAVLHADGDWYASVRVTLDSLYDAISPGGYVVVDDYSVWSGARAAVDDFRAERGIEARLRRAEASAYWRKPA